MSGGGCCNFTNTLIEPNNYLSQNSHFCKSALSRYTQYDFINLVARYDIAYHEKTLGQLFCDNKSKDILNLLLAECKKSLVNIKTDCNVDYIRQVESDSSRFELGTNLGEFSCQSLVVATGGLSIPTLGASGFGYDIAKQFGLKVTAKHAALVSFTLKGDWLEVCKSLAGLSLPVNVSCHNQQFSEALSFTHKGLSGPAILQVSNCWWPGDEMEVNFLPNKDFRNLIDQWQHQGEKASLKNLLARTLPKRFITTWMQANQIEQAVLDTPVKQLTIEKIGQLHSIIHKWRVKPVGTEGYKTAEVTRGGVSTGEISSKTFEAQKAPGLFFIGEVVDVTGWLGGYNFQWAWASGYRQFSG